MTSFAHRVFSNHPEPQTKATVSQNERNMALSTIAHILNQKLEFFG